MILQLGGKRVGIIGLGSIGSAIAILINSILVLFIFNVGLIRMLQDVYKLM